MSGSDDDRRDEERFIEMVRDHPVLYDTKHYEYRNVHLKEKTWGRIAKEFQMDKFSCKKRWRHLRDGYQRYKKTHRKQFTSPNQPLTGRYAQLRFLDKVFCPRKHHYENRDSEDADDDQDVNTDDNDRNKRATPNIKQELNYDPEYSSERENIFVMQHEPMQSDMSTNNAEVSQESGKRDDVEYFCLHVAEVLRKLPPVEKAKAKKQLNDVLFEYELMAAAGAAQSARQSPSTSMGN